MKKFLSIILSILMVVTMLPMAVLPASAAYKYDEATKISFTITNLVMNLDGETYEKGEYGSAIYEEKLTKLGNGKFQFTYQAALSANRGSDDPYGGTLWSDMITVNFDGVNCDSDYEKIIPQSYSTLDGYSFTWDLVISKYKGHVYGSWSDNGNGTHSRTCNACGHVDTVEHNWIVATCVQAKYCKDCGLAEGEPVADAHKWGAYTTNDNGTHTKVCAYNSEHTDTQDCSYSDATCTSLAKCSTCGYTTGDYAKDNHSSDEFKYEQVSADEHKKYHACCEEYIGIEEHNYNVNTGKCNNCGYACEHISFTDGVCDVCNYNCPHTDMTGGKCQMCGMAGSYSYIYREWNSTSNTLDESYKVAPADIIEMTAETTALTDGWYIVKDTITVDTTITTTGTVHLILADNSALNANKGIKINSGTLYIYGQTDDIAKMGKLTATAEKIDDAGIECENGKYLVINGGNISAFGNGAGIGGRRISYVTKDSTYSGVITINGGIIDAKSASNGAGIGTGSISGSGKTGNIYINGGTVNAFDAASNKAGAGIGGGIRANGANVVINGGNIKASGYTAIGNGKYGKNAGSIKNSNGTSLSKVVYTLGDLTAQAKIDEIEGITYSTAEMYTQDTNKLYLYLPADSVVTAITAEGTRYFCTEDNLTFYSVHGWVDSVCTRCGETCDHAGQTGAACEICGAELHTCDFSGEWKYDADKHWKECVADGCDEISEEAVHSYTNGKCDCGYVCSHEKYTDGVCDKCGYECPHEWGEGVLTRPTFETAGYYTYTCTLCGHSYTEPTKKADDTALNDASMKVMECIGNSTLTQEALNEIHNSYLDILKNNGNIFDEFGFVRNDLVEEDQPAINAVTAELEKIIADAEEKIESGEYVKIDGMKEYNKIAGALDAELVENYSQEEIAALAEKAGDEINARFGEIIEKAEALTGTVAENKDALAEIESELSALYGEIKNCLDGVHNGLVYEVTEEAKCGVNAIESATCTLCGETDEREIEGTALSHSFTKYEVTEEAECGKAGKEVAYCDHGCQTTDEKEIPALKHSFTKYEVTEEAECGKAGKEVAYCDHGCGATDENEIPALKHSFVNYVYNNDATCEADGTKTAKCANGCGATNKIKAEGTKLDHVDCDGDYICDYGCGHIFEQPDTPDDPADDTCHMCGGKVHGNDIMSRISCFFAMIIRFVTEVLTSVKK